MRIRDQMQKYLIIMSIIPMLVVMMLSYASLLSNLVRNADNSMQSMMRYCTDELNSIIGDATRLAEAVQNDMVLQELVRTPKSETIPEEYARKINMNSTLIVLRSNTTRYVSDFAVLLDDGRAFKGSIFPLYNRDFTGEAWYRQIKTSGKPMWLGPGKSLALNTMQGECVELGLPLQNYRTGEKCGVILIDVLSTRFEDVFQKSVTLQNISFSISSGDKKIMMVGKQFEAVPLLDRWNLIECGSELSNGWRVTAYCRISDIISENALQSLGVLIGGIVLIAMISVYLSVCISGWISAPLHSLLSHMQNIDEKRLEQEFSTPTNLIEMQDLMTSFNRMTSTVNRLFNELEQKQRSIRKAEYAALQAQINPHFLYNTLDHIAWQIRIGNTASALQSVMAFSRFYRISLSRGNDLITIENELDHARLYLEIQSIRYGDQITYAIKNQLDAQTMSERLIPKLILQPLIENSIYHGVRGREYGGRIEISVQSEGGQIIFTVYDNGAGIEAKRLAELNGLLAAGMLDSRQKANSYGVLNVNQRIKNLFGNQYGLHYHSTAGQFTEALIVVPLHHTLPEAP